MRLNINLCNSKNGNDIRTWDWILIIGLIMGPMTGLRLWKIGPAEILCLIWGMKQLFRRKLKMTIIVRFFTVFFVCMFVGSLIGKVIAPEELDLSIWFSWVYLAAIAIALYTGLDQYDFDYVTTLCHKFCYISVMWYLVLYLYSITISKTILGAPLWYNGFRFTGGALNPHQLAILMCGVIFFFLRNIIIEKYYFKNMVPICIALFILMQTLSSTGYMAVALGFLTEAYLLPLITINDKRSRRIIWIVVTLIVVVILVVFTSYLYDRTYAWIASDPNGLGRIELFLNIVNTIEKSPLFGLGPGTHSIYRWEMMEYHNTYCEIIATTGLVGFAYFMKFTFSIFKETKKDLTLVPIIVAIYAYGLAGFAMRRLVYWGILIFVLQIAKKLPTKYLDSKD